MEADAASSWRLTAIKLEAEEPEMVVREQSEEESRRNAALETLHHHHGRLDPNAEKSIKEEREELQSNAADGDSVKEENQERSCDAVKEETGREEGGADLRGAMKEETTSESEGGAEGEQQNSVCWREASLTTEMLRRLTAELALEMVLAESNPLESDAEDLDLQAVSDSEPSSEEDAPHPLKKKPRLDVSVIETAKDGTLWREEQVGRRVHFSPIDPYAREDGEPTADARDGIKTRLGSFLCFLTRQMLSTVQEWTNQHARDTEPVDWCVALPELMAFIAVIIWRGVIKVPSMCDNWSELYGNPRIISALPRDRFQDIMRHLRFDDKHTRRERVQTDKFAAISELWESFRQNCITFYTPGRHVTVDVQLFPSKTVCPFLQYMEKKPDKFGMKFWVACDLKSKYICNVLPYVGKDPGRPKEESLSENVVMALMGPFLDQGRTVTTDSFFTSISLAKKLLRRKTTILGTLDKIRREIPPSARETNRKKFSTRVFSTADATLTVYAAKTKKSVYVLSSMHSVVQTEDTRKRKPSTVAQYNSTKCGVDVMDQMVQEFSVRAATRRWPVAVFYNMIDMAALNAYVLYQACTGRKERRPDFLMMLASELAQSHVTARKVEKENLRKQPEPGKRKKCQIRYRCNKNPATVQCVHCCKFTCGKCTKEAPWQCQRCSDRADDTHTLEICRNVV